MKIFWKLLLLLASLIVFSCASTASASNIDEEESVEIDDNTRNFLISIVREMATQPTFITNLKASSAGTEQADVFEEFYCFNESSKVTVTSVNYPDISETREIFLPESIGIAYQRPHDDWASEASTSLLFISDTSSSSEEWLPLGVYFAGDTSKFYQLWSREHNIPGIWETWVPHTSDGEVCIQAKLNKYYSEVKTIGCDGAQETADEREFSIVRHDRLTNRFVFTEEEYEITEGIEFHVRSEHLGKCVLSE